MLLKNSLLHLDENAIRIMSIIQMPLDKRIEKRYIEVVLSLKK